MEPRTSREDPTSQLTEPVAKGKGASFFSSAALVVANLVPLYGAIFLDWAVFDIVLLYWLENVIVGFLNAVRMGVVPTKNKGPAEVFEKGFMIVFFLFHFGIFTTVHGVFVFSLFSDHGGVGGVHDLPFLFAGHLKWAILALIASHLISFFFNFLGRKEYLNTTVSKQMGAPYPRMLALHFAIVLGAAAIDAMGQPLIFLVILVVGKTIADLSLHIRSHRKQQEELA